MPMKKAKQHPFYLLRAKRLQLSCFNHDHQHTAPTQRQIALWIERTLRQSGQSAQISVVFFPEDEAKVYNRQYRNKDYATNVLSFPLEHPHDNAILCGDLLICPAVIEREAVEQHKSLTAHYAHMVIHGTLHLLGYDHIEENEAVQMERIETQLLNQLGYPNPYAEE